MLESGFKSLIFFLPSQMLASNQRICSLAMPLLKILIVVQLGLTISEAGID